MWNVVHLMNLVKYKLDEVRHYLCMGIEKPILAKYTWTFFQWMPSGYNTLYLGVCFGWYLLLTLIPSQHSHKSCTNLTCTKLIQVKIVVFLYVGLFLQFCIRGNEIHAQSSHFVGPLYMYTCLRIEVLSFVTNITLRSWKS
jgi:hypothetical protein